MQANNMNNKMLFDIDTKLIIKNHKILFLAKTFFFSFSSQTDLSQFYSCIGHTTRKLTNCWTTQLY